MIDFNADLGEGCLHDAELMRLVSSVNIACGAHAGNDDIMQNTLREAKILGLRVGAHPGYFDREHFGRKEMSITSAELLQTVESQLELLENMAQEIGTKIVYVKPHGAMYHQCNREPALAHALVLAANRFQMSVMSMPGFCIEEVCRQTGTGFLKEGFADRKYRSDGTLMPRSEPGAMVHDAVQAVKQIRWLCENTGVDSICVHGDEPEAVSFVRELKRLLSQPSMPE